MLNAKEIIDIYISFFEKRGHKQIANSPLVPQNDPTTLFTSSGMQPLITYLLGEKHPQGQRLVNVQNSFRAQDIDEVGDNRHTTFFRMLGNWSLGDPASPGEDASQGGYFKAEEIPWLWEFLTNELKLPKEKLYVTVFKGDGNVGFDSESEQIWKDIFKTENLEPKIYKAGVDKNWWSRSGVPDNMPTGEPGGPDSEVYFRFDDLKHEKKCKDNPVECECGKFLEIANSVFMQYIKTDDGTFKELPQKNVDFGGGLERLLAAVEEKSDIFQTSLFAPVITQIEQATQWPYKRHEKSMQTVADHFIAAVFLISAGIKPSKTEQGYILRRLLRRAFDNFYLLDGVNISFVLEKIVEQYKDTDPFLQENFEEIKLTILEEEQNYKRTVEKATKNIKITITHTEGGTETENNEKKLSADETFKLYATHGLSPTQIKSLGYVFDEQKFAELIKKHQETSRKGAGQKFKGGLADTSELTIMGHTATHLLHQALRDVLGSELHQTGSNITSERIRFDFNFDRNLTEKEIKQVEDIVNGKIKENLPVHFEIMPLNKAKNLGAIGLFDDKYQKSVKIYFVGNYSKEFCGGPHVEFTGVLKRFKIKKAENIGKGQRRIYAFVANQL